MAGRNSQSGIALLLVLWVLTVLMVIVLSFSFTARTETHATLAFKEGIEKRFLAEAGMERGIMELFYRQTNKNQAVILEGREVWKVDGTPHSGEIGGGFYRVRIIDESGKVNLNQITDANAIMLRTLLTNLGVNAEEVDVIVDSILDWKDSGDGDAHHTHGVESEYYMSLKNPYEAKNANFDTLEELLLVKGVTSDILYGSDDRSGLIDFLAIGQAGGAGQVNISSAPKEVLMATGMPSEVADEIIAVRQTKEVAPGEFPALQPFLQYLTSGTGGNTFEIGAVGYKDDEKTGFAIKATVAVDFANNKVRYLSYKTPSRIPRE